MLSALIQTEDFNETVETYLQIAFDKINGAEAEMAELYLPEDL